jgi:hypothetical protein
MQARKVNTVNLNACYVGQVGMHQRRLAFNHKVVAQNVFNFKLFKASRTMFTLYTSIIGHKHTKQTNRQIRTIHQSKEKL